MGGETLGKCTELYKCYHGYSAMVVHTPVGTVTDMVGECSFLDDRVCGQSPERGTDAGYHSASATMDF